jgi:hypothetical protein
MQIKLLELEGGAVSLEFEAEDLTGLTTAIRERFGVIRTIEKAPLYDIIEFGGEKFIYYHEWDPCLISQSVAGAKMLREIKIEG